MEWCWQLSPEHITCHKNTATCFIEETFLFINEMIAYWEVPWNPWICWDSPTQEKHKNWRKSQEDEGLVNESWWKSTRLLLNPSYDLHFVSHLIDCWRWCLFALYSLLSSFMNMTCPYDRYLSVKLEYFRVFVDFTVNKRLTKALIGLVVKFSTVGFSR